MTDFSINIDFLLRFMILILFTENKIKNRRSRKKFIGKAHKYLGMRRTAGYAAVTKYAAQRSI